MLIPLRGLPILIQCVAVLLLVPQITGLGEVRSESVVNHPKIVFPRTNPVVLKPIGKMTDPAIDECSGLVKSRKWPGVFWVHNDSGDDPRVFPVRVDGSLVGKRMRRGQSGIRIVGAHNVDWEDIATDSNGHLIIADLGDNLNCRAEHELYVIKEPSPFGDRTANVLEKIRVAYPDRESVPPALFNFDAEGVFCARGKVHVMTKHRSDRDTKLYRLDSVQVQRVNMLTLMARYPIQGSVTAADVSLDERMLAVLTYGHVWLFRAAKGSDDYLRGSISWLPISAGQCEGITFDGADLIIANEQRQIFRLPVSRLIPLSD